ncbi:hypothetical protein Ddc_11275 [Ditylenchus destructor]|nr:hypothetical protein Ddc_11275 [Ditylenchus destructor]
MATNKPDLVELLEACIDHQNRSGFPPILSVANAITLNLIHAQRAKACRSDQSRKSLVKSPIEPPNFTSLQITDRKALPNFKTYRLRMKKDKGYRPPAYVIVTNEEGMKMIRSQGAYAYESDESDESGNDPSNFNSLQICPVRNEPRNFGRWIWSHKALISAATMALFLFFSQSDPPLILWLPPPYSHPLILVPWQWGCFKVV